MLSLGRLIGQFVATVLTVIISYVIYCYLQTPYQKLGWNTFVASCKFKYSYLYMEPTRFYEKTSTLRNSTTDSVDESSVASLFIRHDFNASYRVNGRGVSDGVSAGEELVFLKGDYTLSQDKSLPMRLYVPKTLKDQKLPIWIYLHGGGWHLNNIDVYDKQLRYFGAKFNVAVLSINYRKIPFFSYQQAVNDCLFAVLYASRKSGVLANYNIDGSDVTLVGDSAGANLISSVTHRLRDVRAQDPDVLSHFMIRRQILIYPAVYYYPYDENKFETYIEYSQHGLLLDRAVLTSMWSRYANATMETIINDPEYSYLAVLGPNKHNTRFDQLPTTIIIPVEVDILKSEAIEYGERLKQANVPVYVEILPNMIHGAAFSAAGSKAVGAIIERAEATLNK